MSFTLLTIGFLSVSSLFAYLVSISPLAHFTPQLIALFSIFLLLLTLRRQRLPILYLSFIVNFIVFSTNGLSSPFFFLTYFLLFIIAFQYTPSITLAYSLVLIIILSQSLNSPLSLVTLFSLLLITPLAWFVGSQYLENLRQSHTISAEETDFLLWHNLKFKTGITHIIDHASELLAAPQLSLTHKDAAKDIRDSARYLLNSSKKLTEAVSNNDKTAP